MMADRNGDIYPNGVPPDEKVTAGHGSYADPDDAVEEAAKEWLATQRTCCNGQFLGSELAVALSTH